MYTNLCNKIEKGINYTLALLVISIITIVVVAVFFRYVLNDALSWNEQVTRMMFVWTTFLGSAVLYRNGMHIALDLLLKKLPEAIRATVSIINEVSMLIIFVVFLIYGAKMSIVNINQTFGALDISPSIFYVSAPVSALIMIIFWIERMFIIRSWKTVSEKSEFNI